MNNHGSVTQGETGAEHITTRKGMWGVKNGADTTGFGGQENVVTIAAPAHRPYGGWFDEVVDIIGELAMADGLQPEDVIEKVTTQYGELVIFIKREHLVRVARYLRDDQDLRFELCLGVSAVHYPEDRGRELHGFYTFFSITHNRSLSLDVAAPESDPHIPSIVSVYPGNDWPEREAWDLMGIVFDGHPGLTRSVMPDDWVGHPQRKDYPLGGIPVEYKGAVIPPPDTRREYN
ncbi:NADH-quinone oxidoreductase subunit C [Arcanobacterium haemolyticum]|uniref:NADH-quinone oxidoreductase subunit C n=1 Tax=Arcanobacterium haemolyticum (strain ATCC 9345 / DSM 20595 / CCM 5947 / CCUG 17215 / LMG 16163 / NBRC 15585 / NCTC 8452 / 11018) TaxID=644284 RepID=D7BMA4_ARCHD|nr:NADH-quinone oxidoreductase subunit C [Arcanobacterium haemolyticum]ADH92053.1 NADH (or F420H2) dehydrogenase, subunit C [Arcanobacterium haemolyticum DSM 20595]QCX46226.1 NADH-quinone oxidoreductase subunit C [Arcanobacterium haemolyticum]SQH29243.1 NADH-quinone oxidoreductase subunit C/D [Arcanobacterium haemolyticum]